MPAHQPYHASQGIRLSTPKPPVSQGLGYLGSLGESATATGRGDQSPGLPEQDLERTKAGRFTSISCATVLRLTRKQQSDWGEIQLQERRG